MRGISLPNALCWAGLCKALSLSPAAMRYNLAPTQETRSLTPEAFHYCSMLNIHTLPTTAERLHYHAENATAPRWGAVGKFNCATIMKRLRRRANRPNAGTKYFRFQPQRTRRAQSFFPLCPLCPLWLLPRVRTRLYLVRSIL